MKVLLALIGLACIAPGLSQRGVRQGQPCYTPENDVGQCFTLSNCPFIVNVFNNYPRNVATQYVRAAQRSCGFTNIGGDPVVCCDRNQQIATTPAATRNPFFPTNPSPSTSAPLILEPSTTTSRPTPAPTSTTAPPPPSTTVGISERIDSCRGPDLLYGVCTPLAQCEPLLTKLKANPKDATFANFLKISNKICKEQYAVVCCPSTNQDQFKQVAVIPRNSDDIPKKLLTMEDGCGYVDNAFRKIVGGKTSKIGAWPWIALIGYNDGVSASPFKCGGVLVTSRHIITAAHCIRADLTFVRLGEHDLTTDTETTHIDVPVAKILKHPQYSRIDGHNDIALLYLDRNVQFTAKIAPICLPLTPQLQAKTYVDHTPFVAGWGRTMEGGTAATVLQELQIPIYDNSVCVDLYKKQNRLISSQQFDNAIICAGDLGGGKDTCQGDSGGPLMTPEPFGNGVRFHLLGVVSYGIGCARPDVPGVYSRVANFMDWIQKGIADTP